MDEDVHWTSCFHINMMPASTVCTAVSDTNGKWKVPFHRLCCICEVFQQQNGCHYVQPLFLKTFPIEKKKKTLNVRLTSFRHLSYLSVTANLDSWCLNQVNPSVYFFFPAVNSPNKALPPSLSFINHISLPTFGLCNHSGCTPSNLLTP